MTLELDVEEKNVRSVAQNGGEGGFVGFATLHHLDIGVVGFQFLKEREAGQPLVFDDDGAIVLNGR